MKEMELGKFCFNGVEFEVKDITRCEKPYYSGPTFVFETFRIGEVRGTEARGMLPEINRVIYNDPATIVLWEDGTKTVVKCQGLDEYDEQTGLLMCIAKKAYGNSGKFNDILAEHVPPSIEEQFVGAINDALDSIIDSIKEVIRGE